MTYEERVKHRELVDRVGALRERLDVGEPWAQVTREEAAELTAIVEELLVRVSPERWDHLMETVAHEASRRAGAVAAP